MIQRYFLGANSKDGFVSLYGDFPPDGSFLHIIKGGPGTGKSGFMTGGPVSRSVKRRRSVTFIC